MAIFYFFGYIIFKVQLMHLAFADFSQIVQNVSAQTENSTSSTFAENSTSSTFAENSTSSTFAENSTPSTSTETESSCIEKPLSSDLNHQTSYSTSPEDFSKLKLNVKELYGSRWTINRKEKIAVSHSIEITDATLKLHHQLSLRVEFNLRQSWLAPELEFPPGLFKPDDPDNTFVSADDKVLSRMWAPDSYISTARESTMNLVGKPVSLVYIFKNRTIVFKVRTNTKLGCTSSFQWYPLDVQNCTLQIESYKYHDNIAHYQWTNESLYRPVVVQVRRMFQYKLRHPVTYSNGTVERGGRGKMYAYIQVNFTFERKLGNNIIQVYTPTVLVVVLSWFSFWLGLDAIPGRISLLVTCMLTLVTMHTGMKTNCPPVHYITMMDVWTVSCMSMVFGAICEFVVVKYIHWRQQQKIKVEKEQTNWERMEKAYAFVEHLRAQVCQVEKGGEKDKLFTSVSMMLEPLVLADVEAGERKRVFKGDEEGKRNEEVGKPKIAAWVAVDKLCRAAFPLLFCVFNVIYWPVLLNYGGQVTN